MVGMLQIITYLLCLYLVFKGIEIYQIANMSSREDRTGGKRLGAAMIVISLIASALFIWLIDSQAHSIGSQLPSRP
jgi:hypothetical protein